MSRTSCLRAAEKLLETCDVFEAVFQGFLPSGGVDDAGFAFEPGALLLGRKELAQAFELIGRVLEGHAAAHSRLGASRPRFHHRESEAGLLIGRGHVDAATVRLGDLRRDVEAETEAVAARPDGSAEEGLEQVFHDDIGDRRSPHWRPRA